MSSVVDVSNRLGEYMLKGWVLTDQSCPTVGCTVPMMRSPNGRTPVTYFCANCDVNPGAPRTKPALNLSDSSSYKTSDSYASRSSTPPTDVSSTLSSPVFAPPVDTEESRRRREQSDRASSEIGKRLLKGWAMLGDECPNGNCYGVPLVRPPKSGGEKDPRKECVICGNVYLSEIDWAGRERLIPTNLDPPTSSATPWSAEEMQEQTTPVSKSALRVEPGPIPNTSNINTTVSVGPQQTTSPLQALEESSQALQTTLRALSTQLVRLSNNEDNSAVVDPTTIGLTAEAISKVTQALSHVRQLQWSESQAQRL